MLESQSIQGLHNEGLFPSQGWNAQVFRVRGATAHLMAFHMEKISLVKSIVIVA